MKLLSGTRVLELGGGVPVASATRLLTDLGAEVAKLQDERTVGLDPNPPYSLDDGDPVRSVFRGYMDREKLVFALDLGTESGRDLVCELAGAADVVVVNSDWHPWTALKDRLEGRVPLVCVSSFPRNGSYSGFRGDDLVPFAFSGRMSIHGQPNRAPLGYAPFVADTQVGLTAAAAAAASLLDTRPVTYEISGVSAHLGNVDALIQLFEFTGKNSARGLYGSSAVPAADGYLLVAFGSDDYFARVCKAIGRPDLMEDERFAERGRRAENADVFQGLLLEWSIQRTRSEAFIELQQHGVLCAPILSPSELLADPEVRSRESFKQVVIGDREMLVPGPLLRQWPSATADALSSAGETRSVYIEWLGWTEDRVLESVEAGVIGVGSADGPNHG